MSISEHLAANDGFWKKALIIGLVLAVHAASIWALQQGSKSPTQPNIIPAEMIAQFIAPPAPTPPTPQPPAPPVPPPPKPLPKPKPQTKPEVKQAKPLPLPKAITDPTPAPNAPTGAIESTPTPQESSPAAPTAPSTPVPAAPAPSGGAVELPSSNAAYLNNPRPSYPSISRRMNEQGKVLLRVLVSTQGVPEKIEVKTSSGFERLDKAAVASVQRWRFTPGKRNGIAEAMWNIVPINFVLE